MICSGVRPSASPSRMIPMRMRVPRMQGLPAQTFGSTVTRSRSHSSVMMVLPSARYSSCPLAQNGSAGASPSRSSVLPENLVHPLVNRMVGEALRDIHHGAGAGEDVEAALPGELDRLRG